MIKLCKSYRKYSFNKLNKFLFTQTINKNIHTVNNPTLPVLIVGGGIAGLTLARSCRIANIPFLLFQKSAQFHTQHSAGTGIGLWGPAQRIINALQIGSKIRKVSQRMGCAGYRTKDGSWLAKPPPITGKKITSCLTLLRGDLIQIMMEDLPKQNLFTQHQFLSYGINQSKHSITANFTNGKKYEGSLLVAADGINSGVRKQLYPQIKPIYCGYSYYRAVADIDPKKHQWNSSTPETAWQSWAQDCRIAYVPLQHPKIFWFISKAMPQGQANSQYNRFCEIQSKSSSGLAHKQTQLKLNTQLDAKGELSDWHAPIKSLIQQTPQQAILFTPIRKIEMQSQKWINNRIVLIGDAAHAIPPNLASGGMISMEDAIQLASCIKNTYIKDQTSDNSQYKKVFQQYLKNRKLKVKIIQISNALIAAFGQMYNQSLIYIRDNVIQLIPKSIRTVFFNALHRFYLGWNYTAPDLNEGLYIRLLKCDHNFISVQQLPQFLRLFHGFQSSEKIVHLCEGQVQVTCGQSLVASLITKIATLPPAMKKASVKTTIHQQIDGTQVWIRQFIDPKTNKISIFQTMQYIENEDFVQAVKFGGAIDIQILMTLQLFNDDKKGFKHVYKDTRIRLFRQINGGFSIRVPKFLQSVVNATTILRKNENQWGLNVQVKAPNNLFWRLITGNKLEIGGYKGSITRFHKASMKDYLSEKKQV